MNRLLSVIMVVSATLLPARPVLADELPDGCAVLNDPVYDETDVFIAEHMLWGPPTGELATDLAFTYGDVWNITVTPSVIFINTIDLFVEGGPILGAQEGLNTYTFTGAEAGVGWDIFHDVNVTNECIPAIPEDQLDNLVDDVQTLGLMPSGVENSLVTKLVNARAAYLAGDLSVACDLVQAFVNQVNAQEGSRLTTAEADALRDAADDIAGEIGCT
jgi:hypothetical protein